MIHFVPDIPEENFWAFRPEKNKEQCTDKEDAKRESLFVSFFIAAVSVEALKKNFHDKEQKGGTRKTEL